MKITNNLHSCRFSTFPIRCTCKTNFLSNMVRWLSHFNQYSQSNITNNSKNHGRIHFYFCIITLRHSHGRRFYFRFEFDISCTLSKWRQFFPHNEWNNLNCYHFCCLRSVMSFLENDEFDDNQYLHNYHNLLLVTNSFWFMFNACSVIVLI